MNRSDIRVKALGIFRRGEDILFHEIYEGEDQLIGYRIPGGHVEFGEKAADTFAREIMEELNTGIENVRYLGMVENHFTWNGKQGHEIIFVYEAEFTDKSLYEKDVLQAHEDNGKPFTLHWINPAKRAENTEILPQGLMNILT